MNSIEISEAEQRRAFRGVMDACDFQKMLPDRLFVGLWSGFLFFQSDYVFSPDFANIVREFMDLEGAKVTCLLNLDKTETAGFDGAASLFIDATMDGAAYQERLRAGGPAVGWLFDVDRYVCASDVGEWCIYCEKSNDVAVIGLREPDGRRKFELPLEHLAAKPIEDLIEGGRSPLFPFDRLVSDWREGLVDHYGLGAWDKR